MNQFNDITKQQIEKGPFPLKQILANSLFYPASSFDGGVIKDCNKNSTSLHIYSFIYCDYAPGKEAFLNEQNSLKGYHVLGGRNVKLSELIPNGWEQKLPPDFNYNTYQKYKNNWKPFAYWTIYERDETKNEEHGPMRFSLLYIGGEAVATYQALYVSNKTKAKGLAIIQPGTGFGGNWTNFAQQDKALAWVIQDNPVGKPDIIYYGGMGAYYDDFGWEGYNEFRKIKPYYDNNSGEVRVLVKHGLDK